MNKQTEKFLELTQVEKERDAAVQLLISILKYGDDTEWDISIYKFLEEIGEVPNDFIKYWDDDEE